MTLQSNDPARCAEAIVDRVGRDIRLAVPITWEVSTSWLGIAPAAATRALGRSSINICAKEQK